MSDAHPPTGYEGDVETALLDADLFLKYRAPERAIKTLQDALERRPLSIPLRERLREIAASNKNVEEAARQCLALASLYIERSDFEAAHERLLEAKQLDPRINIAPGLEAIRRARRPNLHAVETVAAARNVPTLMGDLSAISIFDAVQVIENARLTGALAITGDARMGRILFNEGRIVGAETSETKGEEAFRKIVEVTSGTFDFERATQEFPVTIQAASNTNLILDALRQLDEENK
jgi:tetratricopeptide (TPR) repeat protein